MTDTPAGSPVVPVPSARYEAFSHAALAAQAVDGNDPAAAGESGARWAGLAHRLQDSISGLAALSSGSEETWQGDSGDAMRAVLGKAANWLAETATVSVQVADAVQGQAEVAARARADMPPPVDYDPAAMIRSAAASGNVLELAGLSFAMDARRAEADAARQKAIDVLRTRDAALHSLVPRTGFPAVPALGTGPA
ncbi:PPE domain-containing protein [Amycolatopsis benzoatilytica]|uniref:PPE domain-containing protein n=1 Tax=Amycolatopsis benzoatilytica TaxID=346045 RepID=UPI00038070E5|nr:PPE domain-containing protein [Amycolatopsis benzoatilytica]